VPDDSAGGRALFSMFSFAIVTPIVAFYLLCGWKNMITSIDNWVPPVRRDTVRGLALGIDDKVLGFLRGQAAGALGVLSPKFVRLRPTRLPRRPVQAILRMGWTGRAPALLGRASKHEEELSCRKRQTGSSLNQLDQREPRLASSFPNSATR
jgi:hypothetical protein